MSTRNNFKYAIPSCLANSRLKAFPVDLVAADDSCGSIYKSSAQHAMSFGDNILESRDVAHPIRVDEMAVAVGAPTLSPFSPVRLLDTVGFTFCWHSASACKDRRPSRIFVVSQRAPLSRDQKCHYDSSDTKW